MSALCQCGCGQQAPIAKWTNRRLGHVKGQPTRFIHGHYVRLHPTRVRNVGVCAQTFCTRPATVSRGRADYCTMHYRFIQMRSLAMTRGLSVPSTNELEALVPANMRCPICQRDMNWRAGHGHSTVITLQHDRSGQHRLICMACNNRHASKPGDLFYAIPAGHHYCSACDEIKPLSEFWIRGTGGKGKGHSKPGKKSGVPTTPCKSCAAIQHREERDAELHERLRHERDDEPRGRTWAEQAADAAGKPLTGPL